MGLHATKSVFGVSDKVRLKSVSSATETSQNIEISPVNFTGTSLHMILSKKRIKKGADQSAPLLLTTPPKTGFLASRLIFLFTFSVMLLLGLKLRIPFVKVLLE